MTGLILRSCAQCNKYPGAAVDGGGASEAQNDALRAACHGVGNKHTCAVGVAGEGYGMVGNGGQAAGCGDINVGFRHVAVVEHVGGLGESACRVGGGKRDGGTVETARSTLAAVGHGYQYQLGIGQCLGDAFGEVSGGIVGGSGSFESVRCDNNCGHGGGPRAWGWGRVVFRIRDDTLDGV